MIARETYLQLGYTVRKQILQEYTVDSCIATVRATIDLIHKLGADAYAMPVVCMVANRPLWEYADQHGSYPPVGSPEYPEGGYGVGVGFGLATEEDPWAGHVVAIAERRWLLDFSIDQAERGEHGIFLGPVIAPVTERWLRSSDKILAHQEGDTRLHYMRRVGAGADGFKASNNWSGEHAPTVTIRRQPNPQIRADRRRMIR